MSYHSHHTLTPLIRTIFLVIGIILLLLAAVGLLNEFFFTP